MRVESPALSWLLEGCPDAQAIREAWTTDPGSPQTITTGHSFDAVTLPNLLGNATHWALSAQGLHPPTALLADTVVVLLRAGSTWHGPGVPAALELHSNRSRLPLPHPEDCAWITAPHTGRLPGFIPLLTAVRTVIWNDYRDRFHNQPA